MVCGVAMRTMAPLRKDCCPSLPASGSTPITRQSGDSARAALAYDAEAPLPIRAGRADLGYATGNKEKSGGVLLEGGNERMFGSIRSVATSQLAPLSLIAESRGAPFSVRTWLFESRPVAGRPAPVLFLPYRAGEIAALRARGLEAFILSGDRRAKVDLMTSSLGLPPDHGLAEATPQGKADWIGRTDARDTLMLGDGANASLAFDAPFARGTPVIHRGVLEGKADFYYLGRGLAGIRRLFEVNDARRRTQTWLLVFSVAYNLLAVGLAVAGRMSPLLAAVLMPVSSLLTLAIVAGGMRRWLVR